MLAKTIKFHNKFLLFMSANVSTFFHIDFDRLNNIHLLCLDLHKLRYWKKRTRFMKMTKKKTQHLYPFCALELYSEATSF